MPDPKPVQVGRSKTRTDYYKQEDKEKRDTMPAGADATWRAITAGTVLDRSTYQ